VANGPFQLQLTPEDDKLLERNSVLPRLLEGLTYHPWGVRKELLIKKLAGQDVALAVEGARRFRLPSGLGTARYEGGHVLVFRRDLGAAGDAVKKALADAAAKAQRIAGREVFALEEKFENDVWKFYFAQPKPNVLVCATDPSYLTEMFRRMDRPEEQRALPKDLPEWKYVDTTARFWAVRHYGEAGDGDDVGFGEGRDKKTPPKIKYLSGGKNAREVKKAWTYVGEATWKPEVQQLAPGVIEVTAHLRRNGDAVHFLFVLLNHLGHAIAV
jgi:hypothetical protein